METIKYKDLTITSIMKEMLCWNDDESEAVKQFVICKVEPRTFPWCVAESLDQFWWAGGWKHAKEITIEKYPKVMMVSDEPITKDNPGEKRVVYHYNPKSHYSYECYPSHIKSLEDLYKEKDPIKHYCWEGRRYGVFAYAQDYKESTID